VPCSVVKDLYGNRVSHPLAYHEIDFPLFTGNETTCCPHRFQASGFQMDFTARSRSSQETDWYNLEQQALAPADSRRIEEALSLERTPAQIEGMKTDVSTHQEFASTARVLPLQDKQHLTQPTLSYSAFLGRPPFLPHRESFLRYLRVVAFPPFLPMHRGQINLVMGCIEQYVSLRTTYFYPKRPFVKPPAGFFLPLPPCFPQSDSWSLCLSAVASPPPDAMHLGQISFVCK
jgi:hypothetical protein